MCRTFLQNSKKDLIILHFLAESFIDHTQTLSLTSKAPGGDLDTHNDVKDDKKEVFEPLFVLETFEPITTKLENFVKLSNFLLVVHMRH